MNTPIYLTVIILIISGCCRQHPEINGNAEVIDIPNKVTESIFDIADNYRYVTLDVENEMDAVLGGIAKLRVFRDRIYVMDNVILNNLLIFDQTGAFLKKVSRIGGAPFEYSSIATFEIDRLHEEILLKEEPMGGKILVFDLDGNYKYHIESPVWGGGIAVLPNGHLVYGIEAFRTRSNKHNLGSHTLAIYGRENNLIGKYCKDDTRLPYASQNFINPSHDGTVTFAPQFMNDVFSISEDGVEHIYSINFPDMLDREKTADYEPMEFFRSPLAQKTIFVGNHADSKDYFCFRYDRNHKGHTAYYNKEHKSTIVCDDRLCAKNLTFDEQGNIWGSIMDADIFNATSGKAAEIKDAIEKSGNPLVVCYSLVQ